MTDEEHCNNGTKPRRLMEDEELPEELRSELNASALHSAAQSGDLLRVQELLADGHSPNCFDECAKTALHYAAEGEYVDVMRALLEAGADVNAHDADRIGNTPLREVAENCSLAVAQLPIDFGADPRIPGWMQLTATHKAAARSRGDGPKVAALLAETAKKLGHVLRPPPVSR
jgi:ankyrin repeat protein